MRGNISEFYLNGKKFVSFFFLHLWWGRSSLEDLFPSSQVRKMYEIVSSFKVFFKLELENIYDSGNLLKYISIKFWVNVPQTSFMPLKRFNSTTVGRFLHSTHYFTLFAIALVYWIRCDTITPTSVKISFFNHILFCSQTGKSTFLHFNKHKALW